ncbi:hypothetical protein DB345_11230 [Spartobacteria bacterium LR76]|nr:hypothetical protein DB345_11230 [Spartobacteria bacterium LR76]
MIRYDILPWIGFALISLSSVASAETLAYFRFEGEGAGAPVKNVKDSAGKSSAKGSWNVVYSSDVPLAVIPQTGEANTGAISFPAEGRKGDIFSDPNSAINTHRFTDFTIEAWVRFDTIEGAYQTIIGRDKNAAASNLGRVSLFYLSRTPENAKGAENPGSLRLEIINSDGQSIFANTTTVMDAGVWYHVAVVGDTKAGTITLFVNGTAEGYGTGYTGLYIPEGGSSWTFGRGQYNGRAADFVTGAIDEVRFSDVALSPSQFLYAPKTK